MMPIVLKRRFKVHDTAVLPDLPHEIVNALEKAGRRVSRDGDCILFEEGGVFAWLGSPHLSWAMFLPNCDGEIEIAPQTYLHYRLRLFLCFVVPVLTVVGLAAFHLVSAGGASFCISAWSAGHIFTFWRFESFLRRIVWKAVGSDSKKTAG